MKKILICLMLIVLSATTAFGAAASKNKSSKAIDIEMETKDGFVITAKLYTPPKKNKKYPLVVLLHSLGYSSKYWGSIPTDFQKAGLAVLAVDFRGHGTSVNDTKFRKYNWIYMPKTTYSHYPQDVLDLLVYVNDNYKNVAVNHLAFIGADIGANTAILASQKLKTNPVAMVLICPTEKFKGLYTPIAIANLGKTPILFVYSGKDSYSKGQTAYLKRFVQGAYGEKVFPNGGFGMLMLKLNKGMDITLTNWVVSQFNASFTAPKK